MPAVEISPSWEWFQKHPGRAIVYLPGHGFYDFTVTAWDEVSRKVSRVSTEMLRAAYAYDQGIYIEDARGHDRMSLITVFAHFFTCRKDMGAEPGSFRLEIPDADWIRESRFRNTDMVCSHPGCNAMYRVELTGTRDPDRPGIHTGWTFPFPDDRPDIPAHDHRVPGYVTLQVQFKGQPGPVLRGFQTETEAGQFLRDSEHLIESAVRQEQPQPASA